MTGDSAPPSHGTAKARSWDQAEPLPTITRHRGHRRRVGGQAGTRSRRCSTMREDSGRQAGERRTTHNQSQSQANNQR
ncbi:hypothetical protein N9L68_01830 [bacterium]|nr:hypothetical protein [bacterium]